MRAIYRFFTFLLFLAMGFGFLNLAGAPWPVKAASSTPTPATPAVNRKQTITADVASYEWWIVRWKTNKIHCVIPIEHEGPPTHAEIYAACTLNVANDWSATSNCPSLTTDGDTTGCSGDYLLLGKVTQVHKDIVVTAPPPTAWVSITGCNPLPPSNICDGIPSLLITGEETLTGQTITGIQGNIDGQSFACNGDACPILLLTTGGKIVRIEFWANSSKGDSSKHFSALVRVAPVMDSKSSVDPVFAPSNSDVDVVSSQWRGAPLPGCSQMWEVLPELGGPPAWLTAPEYTLAQYTSVPFDYASGLLLQPGQVNLADCASGACAQNKPLALGSQKLEWAGLEIVPAARDSNVPPHLLTYLLNQESQSWLAAAGSPAPASPGQLTEGGADAVFLWNPSFFTQFCSSLIDWNICAKGYSGLGKETTSFLRKSLVEKSNPVCQDCSGGIDVDKARFNIKVLAASLQANCAQTGRIVRNVTSQPPGQSASYEDLWRFTLLNYFAGPGCFGDAIQAVKNSGKPLDWPDVSGQLAGVCKRAIQYVEEVSQKK